LDIKTDDTKDTIVEGRAKKWKFDLQGGLEPVLYSTVKERCLYLWWDVSVTRPDIGYESNGSTTRLVRLFAVVLSFVLLSILLSRTASVKVSSEDGNQFVSGADDLLELAAVTNGSAYSVRMHPQCAHESTLELFRQFVIVNNNTRCWPQTLPKVV